MRRLLDLYSRALWLSTMHERGIEWGLQNSGGRMQPTGIDYTPEYWLKKAEEYIEKHGEGGDAE